MRTIASASALLLGLLAAGCTGELVGGGLIPAQVVVVSGDMQLGTVGEELAQPLVVRVVDERNRPVKSQLVNFVVTAGGGTVFAGTSITNEDGEARERWTLGTVAGDTQRVEARAVDPATGKALVFATFRAVARPGAPTAMAAVGGTALTGSAGMPLADSLGVRVADRYDNPVPGVTVAWTVRRGGGSLSPVQTTTGPAGIARTQWILGSFVDSTHVAEAALSTGLTAAFTAQAGTPAAATLVPLSGDGQSGTVGQALADSLVVALRLPDGRPVIGAAVVWSPGTGGGSVSPAVSTTDATGRTATRWTLPTTAGAATVTASTPGVFPAGFTATARPGAPASLVAVGGGGQTGQRGELLGDPFRVRVLDAHGNRVPGVLVHWAVTSSSGAVQPDTVRTDANGEARAMGRLGADGAALEVTATVGGLTPLRFTANGQQSLISVASPQAGWRFTEAVDVRVTVVAGVPVAAITASAGGRSVGLVNSGGTWQGQLGLTGLPFGPYTVLVRALSASGAVLDSRSIPITYEGPPVIQIDSPAPHAVVSGQIRVVARCVDASPQGCSSMEVWRMVSQNYQSVWAKVATGTSVDVVIPESSGLMFLATGTTGFVTRVVRLLHRTDVPVAAVATVPGLLLDADADRLMYLYDDGMSPTELRVRTRATGHDAAVAPYPTLQGCSDEVCMGEVEARLIPGGAMYRHPEQPGEFHPRLKEWRGGPLLDLGLASRFKVEGRWALWVNSQGTLIRRDLAAATNLAVSTEAGNIDNDVAANGDVVFYDDSQWTIHRFRGGATTRLTPAGDSLWHTYPLTDGINVVYRKGTPCCAQRPRYQLMVIDANGQESELTTPVTAPVEPTPGRAYQVRDGRIAYLYAWPTSVQQIWMQSPSGQRTQLTTYEEDSQVRLDQLGEDGELVYSDWQGRYAVRPGGTRVAVSKQATRWVWINGQLHGILGNTLFRVNW